MSRIGKKPVVIPEKVKIKIADSKVYLEGPLGKEEFPIPPTVVVTADQKVILVKPVAQTIQSRQMYGAARAILQNLVTGISQGFKKVLDIQGVGYRAEAKGDVLNLTLGFSHPVSFSIPKGIKVAVEKQTKVTISGTSKDLVGQVAATIRALRPPEPYKGKGIRYENEVIQRKVGKAAATAGGSGGGK